MGKKEEEINEEEFYLQRLEQLRIAASENTELYPHKYVISHSLSEAKHLAESCDKDQQNGERVSSAARVISRRGHGKLFFFTVESDMTEIQLVLNSGSADIYKTANFIRRGDIVGFSGTCGRSRTGEPSIFLDALKVLSPCLRVIPSLKSGLANAEVIYRNRHLDLLVNKESKQRFINRSKIVQEIRSYLLDRDFLEVETPMMNAIHGGAAAKPFITHHNELGIDLYMRVAPELFLKKLVVGGLNRVFEIGKQFRNEGIDLTHNPEFTSVEFYQAYADYGDLMDTVEELLCGICQKVRGSLQFTYSPEKRGEEEVTGVPLDFSRPFKRIDILEELSNKLGMELTGENVSEDEMIKKLLQAGSKKGISVDEPHTLNRVLDKLVSELIEPQCINPTFVIGFPTAMSPLAKDDRIRKGVTERFELFVNRKELCNAYTELNIPSVQRERFKMQAVAASAGDEEAMPVDEDFCEALEYALPPTGGCGIGIDRLVMYLTDAANIRDVIFFPTMRPKKDF